MADQDSTDTSGEVPLARPSHGGLPQPEGIRIIGAKEAAEAARDGDTVAEADAPHAGEFGAVPIVRPGEVPPELVTELPPVEPQESFELPHYSEPPTGQVPKVVIGEETDASWSTLADAPRWRDTEHQFAEQTDISELPLLNDDAPKLGALDPDRAATVFFTDDDLDPVPPVGRPAEPPTRPESGVVVDPDDADFGNVDTGAVPAVRRPPRPRRRPPRDGLAAGAATGNEAAGGGRNLPVAIAVGLSLLGVGLLCFWLGSFATMVLVTVVLGLCAVEFFDALRRGGYQPASLLGIVGVLSISIAPLYRGFFAYPVVFGLLAITRLAWFLFVQKGEGAIMNLGATLFGVLYVGGLGSFATLALGVARPFEGETSNQGIGIVIAAVIITVAYDVGAYFIGRQFGRSSLSVTSPNKTWEGLGGGVAVGVFVPFLIIWLAKVDPVGVNASKAFAFCLICALVAPLGDLAESAIKRDLQIKDMGTLLPGHGGVLDRFDGMLFVLPTAYFMAHLLDLGRNLSFGP